MPTSRSISRMCRWADLGPMAPGRVSPSPVQMTAWQIQAAMPSRTFSNNVTRRLERLGIAYELLAYDYGPHVHTAVEAADFLQVPVAQVFKTLVVCDAAATSSWCICLVPAPVQLALKVVARHQGARKMQLATPSRAESWTGMKTGGISPFGLLERKRPFLLDDTAMLYDSLILSAGQRGYQVRVCTQDAIQVLNPAILALSQAVPGRCG